MPDWSIGAVARRVGLRSSALRYYERAGLLPAPARLNGRRRYDERVIARLAAIQAAQRAGFTIAEIRTLLDGFAPEVPFSERWRTLAAQKQAELAAVIARAQAMQQRLAEGATCDCEGFETCGLLGVDGTALP